MYECVHVFVLVCIRTAFAMAGMRSNQGAGNVRGSYLSFAPYLQAPGQVYHAAGLPALAYPLPIVPYAPQNVVHIQGQPVHNQQHAQIHSHSTMAMRPVHPAINGDNFPVFAQHSVGAYGLHASQVPYAFHPTYHMIHSGQMSAAMPVTMPAPSMVPVEAGARVSMAHARCSVMQAVESEQAESVAAEEVQVSPPQQCECVTEKHSDDEIPPRPISLTTGQSLHLCNACGIRIRKFQRICWKCMHIPGKRDLEQPNCKQCDQQFTRVKCQDRRTLPRNRQGVAVAGSLKAN
eukprot:m.186304 g.186304  ORF g.186304 m.186304 type:complete len:291 (+) comp14753_c0_seq5:1601-2473(+)